VTIPIQNIYYLLCYACGERISTTDLEPAGVVEGPDSLPNLLASVFTRRLKPLLRRGLDRSYINSEEETMTPRGRMDFAASVSRCSLRRHMVVCRQDELDANVPHNQILRATLHILGTHGRLERSLRLEAARIERTLRGIDLIRPDAGVFRQVRLHRNNSNYRFLLQLCELIWLNLLPESDYLPGRSAFEAVRDDEKAMRRIFEEFIGNFYRFETPAYHVRSQFRLDWDVDKNSDLRYLPVMRADAVLQSRYSSRLLIIDAKYYQETLVSYYEQERVRSGHLYQITAYLRSTQFKNKEPEGLLIYPQVGTAPIGANFCLSGRIVRVRTLNLMKYWQEVHHSLCDLVMDDSLGNGSQNRRFETRAPAVIS